MRRTATSQSSRREFLRYSSLGVAGGASLGFLAGLPGVRAEEAAADPSVVMLDERIRPLVRLLEETPRQRLLEAVADGIRRRRWSYGEVLAALLLAGVRNVQPRPSVGFKFHCVLVVNSCHLASLYGPAEERWLPIFWALDYFKSAQADEARQSGWRMEPVNEARVPKATAAREAFIRAMDRWDVEAADAATAGLVRSCGSGEIFDLFARYAARDYRSIGHKVIFLANGWRTLQVIGWNHAEPILRSLTFALLMHTGDPNPAESDLEEDRPWRETLPLAKKLPSGWLAGNVDEAAVKELPAAFRGDSATDAARTAAELIGRGVAPASIWDGVFLGAGELLMRQPGIIGLHGLTTANAMRYVWQHAGEEETRRRLLLQACAFNPMFRQSAKRRGGLRDRTLADVAADPKEVKQYRKGAPGETEKPLTGLREEILADISRSPDQAAAKVRTYLAAGGDARRLIADCRRLIFFKGRNAHDYKYSSAVLEDYHHVTPASRDLFLALSVYNLKGSRDRDSQLVERTREALG